MTTVHAISIEVQPSWSTPLVVVAVEPSEVVCHEEEPSYQPSPRDEARHVAETRALGHDLGYRGTGLSEPPAKLSDAAKLAYREGYAAGVAAFVEEREFEAWVDSCEAEALERHVAITDRDVWPVGCVS